MKDRQDVLKEIAHLHSIGINAFFNFGSGQDAKDSNHDIAQAVQGGLGMPDRDYYTKQDADMKEKREKYVAHVTKMLTLLGQPPEKAAEDAKKIMALETKLAEASRTRVELRDPIKNYNKMRGATAAGPDARLEVERLFQLDQPARAGERQRASAGVFQSGEQFVQIDSAG